MKTFESRELSRRLLVRAKTGIDGSLCGYCHEDIIGESDGSYVKTVGGPLPYHYVCQDEARGVKERNVEPEVLYVFTDNTYVSHPRPDADGMIETRYEYQRHQSGIIGDLIVTDACYRIMQATIGLTLLGTFSMFAYQIYTTL